MSRVEWIAKVQDPELAFDKTRVEKWLAEVARMHNHVLGRLTYIFFDDDEILEVNNKYLGHNYYTDIITFDDTLGRCISGTMFISVDTVRSNAQQVVNCSVGEELMRVIVHGVLHLCGINDKGPGEREIMEAEENAALTLLKSLQDNDF